MRTDAQIDHRQVTCPNATHLGFAKVNAQRGDLIVYKETYTDGSFSTRIARMIGRVHYAPAIADDKEPVRDFLLVLVLSDNGCFCYERWINPKDVTEVQSFPAKFWQFFAAPLQYSAETYRHLNNYGTLCEQFVEGIDQRVKEGVRS